LARTPRYCFGAGPLPRRSGPVRRPASIPRQVSRPKPKATRCSPWAWPAAPSTSASLRPTTPKTCNSWKQGGVSLRFASSLALHCGHTRERDDLISGPEPALVLAISASLHLVDPLVLATEDAKDLQVHESRDGSASDCRRCALCFAIIGGSTPRSWHDRSCLGFRHQQGSGSTSAQTCSHTKGGLCRPSRPGRLAVAAPWVCELVTTRRTAEPERSTAARPWRCTSPSPPRSRSWDGRKGFVSRDPRRTAAKPAAFRPLRKPPSARAWYRVHRGGTARALAGRRRQS